MNEYVAQPMSDWCMWAFVTGLVGTAIFLLLFAQLTMRRIEKQIKQDKVETYQSLDFGGTRIITYAYVIVLPEKIASRMDRLINVGLVRHYANKRDWFLGLGFILAGDAWIISVMLCFFLG